jgi:hypothetical protein
MLPFVNADSHLRHCGAYALSVGPIIEVACIHFLGAHDHREPSPLGLLMRETRRECLKIHQFLGRKLRILRRVVYKAGGMLKSNLQKKVMIRSSMRTRP